MERVKRCSKEMRKVFNEVVLKMFLVTYNFISWFEVFFPGVYDNVTKNVVTKHVVLDNVFLVIFSRRLIGNRSIVNQNFILDCSREMVLLCSCRFRYALSELNRTYSKFFTLFCCLSLWKGLDR